MKICNNCGALNKVAAEKCNHCHMSGNFRPQESLVHVPRFKKPKVQCLNCGSHEPGEGDKCAHCRFPKPIKAYAGDAIAQSSRKPNLRVG